MIHVVDIKNPFDLLDGHSYHKVDSASSVWDMLAKIGWTSAEYTLLITIGNKELPEDEWDNPIPDGSHVGVTLKIEGGAVAYIIIAIVSIVVALSFSVAPPGVVNTVEADPVFSLKGQTNQIKLNEPIESCYGDVRHWPSQGATAYNKYIDNNAWQFTLLCLGHGEFDVSQISHVRKLIKVMFLPCPNKPEVRPNGVTQSF